ncbi:MAG: hypothetical protein ABSF91_08780 [Bacteroidota bacterium]|jgi:hypothetical protein
MNQAKLIVHTDIILEYILHHDTDASVLRQAMRVGVEHCFAVRHRRSSPGAERICASDVKHNMILRV